MQDRGHLNVCGLIVALLAFFDKGKSALEKRKKSQMQHKCSARQNKGFTLLMQIVIMKMSDKCGVTYGR